MKLKIENGNVVLKDGLPVYQYDDGTEAPFDAAATLAGLNNKIKAEEEKTTRFYQKAEEFQKKYEPFSKYKIEDVTKALDTVKNLSDQQILDQRGIEDLKRQMRVGFDEEKSALGKSYEQRLQEIEAGKKDLTDIIYDLAVTNKFATSPYFAGGKAAKTIYPPEHAARIFGNRFKVDINGKNFRVVALDDDAKPLMSKKNHGELADFDEAIGMFVDNESKRVDILRGSGPGGPGSSHQVGGPRTKADFDSLPAIEKIKIGLQKMKGIKE